MLFRAGVAWAYLKEKDPSGSAFTAAEDLFTEAETEGFEPSCPEGQPDFESGALRPLRYVSIKLTRLLL